MKEQEYLKIVSHVSPMRLFILGYQNQNKPIIFDDCDCLLQSDSNVALLKMFCDTSETKEINWATTSTRLDEEGIPEKYETKSRVIIICNNFNELTEKISALKDRGWHLEFRPTNEELLSKMKSLLPLVCNELSLDEKTEVYELIEKYSIVAEVSLRTLIKGLALYSECKQRGIDWRTILLSSLEINPKLVFLDKISREYQNEAERIKVWENQGGFSTRSYYDYRAKLNAKLQTPLENACSSA